jgi:phosphate starvation-inducible PhoH-like protein
LNEEQKIAKAKILTDVVTILRGKAGSGKSLLAANIALDLLFNKEIEKIIITRPTVVAGEDIGYLPGDVNEKLAPFTAPVYENMHRLYNKEKIEKCIVEGEIEIVPVSFMRGRNFTNCLVVVDEAQNLTDNQTELLLTRICSGSKMIFCGDGAQIDLRDKKTSGFDVICKHMKEVPGFNVITLEKNHRHPIVDDILEVYKSFRG